MFSPLSPSSAAGSTYLARPDLVAVFFLLAYLLVSFLSAQFSSNFTNYVTEGLAFTFFFTRMEISNNVTNRKIFHFIFKPMLWLPFNNLDKIGKTNLYNWLKERAHRAETVVDDNIGIIEWAGYTGTDAQGTRNR